MYSYVYLAGNRKHCREQRPNIFVCMYIGNAISPRSLQCTVPGISYYTCNVALFQTAWYEETQRFYTEIPLHGGLYQVATRYIAALMARG